MSLLRSLLTCSCLPERIFGTDVDEILAYQTPKVVNIRDRTLGVLKYIFMLIIFCYVVVFQVLYKGSHFQLDHLSGVARLQLQHPTKLCNPMDLGCLANYSSLQKLPYCSQYTGKKAAHNRKKCKYFDALDLLTPVDAGYIVPSYIEIYDQSHSCKPNAANGFKCSRPYDFLDEKGDVQKGPGRAKPKAEFYVADIEAFTLLIDHSFRVETGSVEYDDINMQGYWVDCSKKQWTLNSTWLSTEAECKSNPIVCMHKDCKKLGMVTAAKVGRASSNALKAPAKDATALVQKAARQHSKSSVGIHVSAIGSLLQSKSAVSELSQVRSQRLQAATVQDETEEEISRLFSGPHGHQLVSNTDVYSLQAGDVLSISTLFAMAGRSLDDVWFDPSTKSNMSARKRGTVLVVNIHYNNLKPWTLFRPQDPPDYTISVTSQPVEKYKHMSISENGPNRELTVAYGTLVIVQSSGTIGVFRMIHMLIVVSTSLGLLAAASVITDALALYLLPMREEYSKAKFQETADFHDIYVKRGAAEAATEASSST